VDVLLSYCQKIRDKDGFVISLLQIYKFSFILLGRVFILFMMKSLNTVGVGSYIRVQPLRLILMDASGRGDELFDPILN